MTGHTQLRRDPLSTSERGNFQRLLDDADRSLGILSSLDEAMDASANEQTASTLAPHSHSQPLSYDLLSHAHQEASGEPEPDAKDTSAVDLSVQNGRLHVKGVFPDQSVEYVDIDPRFTTIGDLKFAFCRKREPWRDLGFRPQQAQVMIDGQRMEDDWLAVDCGMGFDGTLYIVQSAAPSQSQSWVNSSFGSTLAGRRRPPWASSSQMSVASISATYATPESMEQDQETSNSLTQWNDHREIATSEAVTRHVRPEEAQFADMLSDFYEHLPNVRDTEAYADQLLGGYIDTLQSRLEKIDSELNAQARSNMFTQRMQSEAKQLRDERNTWRLLYELRQVQTNFPSDTNEQALAVASDVSSSLHTDMVDDDAVSWLSSHNQQFATLSALKNWLETTAVEQAMTMGSRQRADHARTLRWLHGVRESGSPAEVDMDPDAVFRQGDEHLAADDAEDEMELLKSVWLLVRSGQTSEAVDLCARAGQSWRAASLSGGNPVGAAESSDGISRWGNPTRALWKQACWKLSEAQEASVTKRSTKQGLEFEKLVYAALSGNAHGITSSPLCESWEHHCWAMVTALGERLQDQALCSLLQMKAQRSKYVVGNNASYMRVCSNLLDKTSHLSRYEKDLDALFDELKHSSSQVVRNEGQEPLRCVQAKLATSQMDAVVGELASTLLPADNFYHWDLELDAQNKCDNAPPSLLRLAAHLVLIVDFTGGEFEAQRGEMLLKLYIRHLVRHGQLTLVPIYASQLPRDGSVAVYKQMLALVDDVLERELCLKRLLEYADMDLLSAVLRAVVADACRLPEESITTHSHTTSDEDRRRIRCIEYLCFYEAHRAEALRAVSTLSRQFAVQGKMDAVKELFQTSIPEDSISVVEAHRSEQSLEEDDIELVLREFLCWQAFLRACTRYDAWRNFVSSNGARPSVYSEEKEMVEELTHLEARASGAITEALHFERGWLLACSPQHVVDADAVRSKCLPMLVFNLHRVQFESAKLVLRLKYYPEEPQVELARPWLEKSLQIADVVADDLYGVQGAMSKQEARDLLQRLHDSAVALIAVEEPSGESSER